MIITFDKGLFLEQVRRLLKFMFGLLGAVCVIFGIVIIFGTAGASDIESISIYQAIRQAFMGIILLVMGLVIKRRIKR